MPALHRADCLLRSMFQKIKFCFDWSHTSNINGNSSVFLTKRNQRVVRFFRSCYIIMQFPFIRVQTPVGKGNFQISIFSADIAHILINDIKSFFCLRQIHHIIVTSPFIIKENNIFQSGAFFQCLTAILIIQRRFYIIGQFKCFRVFRIQLLRDCSSNNTRSRPDIAGHKSQKGRKCHNCRENKRKNFSLISFFSHSLFHFSFSVYICIVL